MDYFYLIFLGAVISLITVLLLGKKGARYPGGSVVSGMFISHFLEINIFIGAICGFAGWLIVFYGVKKFKQYINRYKI